MCDARPREMSDDERDAILRRLRVQHNRREMHPENAAGRWDAIDDPDAHTPAEWAQGDDLDCEHD